MRWSEAFIPTLRDDPADAEAASHKLLVRAGFVRQLMAGAYSLLPLGQRVCRRSTRIVRAEMDAIGGQEFKLPALHPAELWKRSGRWEAMGEEMFRLATASGADIALGMTHEEVFATLARRAAQLQGAAADLVPDPDQVPRRAAPEVGRAARARVHDEGLVLASTSTQAGLDASFQRHFEAYRKIFLRCGIEHARGRGVVGQHGRQRVDRVHGGERRGRGLRRGCARCGYAANVEKATSQLSAAEDGPRARARPSASRRRACARSRTSRASRAARPPSARSRRSSTRSTACSRSCCCAATTRSPSRSSLDAAARARSGPRREARSARRSAPARAASARSASEARTVIADFALDGRRDMTTGANQDDFHLRGVDVARDIARRRTGSTCARCARARAARSCGEPLRVREDDRGRPHLQARHALQRGARRDGARRDGHVAADRHGLVRDRHRARDGRGGRALSRRERHRLADGGGALRGGRHAREPERPRDRARRAGGSTTRCAGPASTCCSTIATSGPA